MKTFFLLVLFFVFPAATRAVDENANSLVQPTNRLASIEREYAEAESAFYKTNETLPDTAEGRKKSDELWKEFDKKQSDLFSEAVALAKLDPKSNSGFAALEWVLTIPRAYYLPAGKQAMELATQFYAADPKVGKIIAWVGYYTPDAKAESCPAAINLIQNVAEKNPDRTARGQAMIALAWQAKEKFSKAEYNKTSDVDTLAIEAEKAFEIVIKEYADCPRLMKAGQRSLGKEAEQELFELRNLRTGKMAPDIEAKDLDGTSFKLSDYRGRVTVLVFWASWCGPCMAMVPDERRLVDRMKNQSFVLIGVNGDPKLDDAKRAVAKESMVWRSFWNGTNGPAGPISHAWNVRVWPTIYVLDGKGVIREKNVRGEELDKAVDLLIKAQASEKL
ncbi:MAG: TlpA disulfide reductase family protein [Verrucomicrobiia bacterium]